MKKENVYVPIANKKEAKRAKAVLEAMGEKIGEDYYPFDDGHNKLAYQDGWYLTSLDFGYEHITLKQLIELLVSEQKEPEKIAALDWIEAQKPKEVIIEISQGLYCIVSKKEIDFPTLELCITKEDLKSIHKTMEDLNS